jgi:hypothetical protein
LPRGCVGPNYLVCDGLTMKEESRTVAVAEKVSDTRRQGRPQARHETKSAAGRRIVPLPPARLKPTWLWLSLKFPPSALSSSVIQPLAHAAVAGAGTGVVGAERVVAVATKCCSAWRWPTATDKTWGTIRRQPRRWVGDTLAIRVLVVPVAATSQRDHRPRCENGRRADRRRPDYYRAHEEPNPHIPTSKD